MTCPICRWNEFELHDGLCLCSRCGVMYPYRRPFKVTPNLRERQRAARRARRRAIKRAKRRPTQRYPGTDTREWVEISYEDVATIRTEQLTRLGPVTVRRDGCGEEEEEEEAVGP